MKTLQCYRKAVHYSEEWKSEILLSNFIDLPPKRLFLFISSWKAVDIVTVPIVWADWSTNWCQFLYLHRKWKFWWHVEINSNRTIDVDPILQGDFVKCNTLPRPPPILIVRICWDSDFKLCIAVHGNFQGHGNFHGYQLWVLHGIFHGPWKFPWGSLSQIPRPWKFPWGREISMRVLITPQTGGVILTAFFIWFSPPKLNW